MANYRPGQLGSFNGKIGQVVVCKWRDMMVGKSAPAPSKKAPTLTQQDQRSKFGLVTNFLSSIANVVAFGFRTTKANNSPMNAAVRYHIANAITGNYPDYEIDFTRVLMSMPLSKNQISMVDAVEVLPIAGHKLTVTWEANTFPLELTKDTDVAHLLFYSEDLNQFLYVPGVVNRTALTLTVNAPRALAGKAVHGYMLFTSVDQKAVSNTEYLGLHTLLA